MIDCRDTIISQYAHSPIMLSIIERWNDCLDPSKDIQAFYENVWNISTANGLGLDIWGRIVDIPREFKLTARDEFIGFTDGFLTFGEGVWSTSESNERLVRLDDEAYRNVILLKAMSNIIYATAPNINRLLRTMFHKRGRAYFVKSNTMAARYVFEFFLSPIERALIRQTDLLPRPSGVLLDWYEPDIDKTLGFIEANLAPFGEGAFFLGD